MIHYYENFLKANGYQFCTEYRSERDACLIGFKTDQFELISSIGVQHNDMADHLGDTIFRKSNAGILCKLKHKESKREFIVAATHVHWNPQNDFIKYMQMYNMFLKIQEFDERVLTD